jgi:hypothetical protein
MTHRFVKAALKAVQDVNALDPQPESAQFTLFPDHERIPDTPVKALKSGRVVAQSFRPPQGAEPRISTIQP